MPTECGQTSWGSYPACPQYSCSRSSNPCPSSWRPYGFAVPGDSQYSFGLSDNNTRDVIGLAAHGNVILGDYTSSAFALNVLPLLQPSSQGNPDGKTQPYVVDPTDGALGYDDALASSCHNQSPCFSGDYTQVDARGAGEKTDGQPRRFYESSLPDRPFQKLVDPAWNPAEPQAYRNDVMAVLYTNHALAGYVPGYGVGLFGSIVSRDDALSFGGDYVTIVHDLRLLNSGHAAQVALPLSFARPRLRSWHACPPSGCSP